MTVLKGVFWGSLGALAWTHAGYPLAAALLSRLRPREVRKADLTPTVTVIVAAWNEESVIGRRVENLLEQDYPQDRFEVVVASDSSTDRTDEIVQELASRDARVRLLRCERGGKVAAQNRAVSETTAELLAFTDAATEWAPEALRRLVRSFADPDVAYVTGGHVYRSGDGTNRESTYWRYENWVRGSESRLGSVTGGIGPIYAVRRSDYVDVDPRFGHDLAFPYLMVQRGRRAVYDPDALAFEKPSRDLEDEYRRKVRMLEHCWLITLRGGMLRGLGPLYGLELVSHRHLRYASGVLHLLALGSNAALVRERGVYRATLAGQLGLLAMAAAGRAGIRVPGAALAYYYVLVTWATVEALANYLRRGVPATWAPPEGTR